MYNAENIIQVFQKYYGNTIFYILFLVSILYYYMASEKEKKKRLLLMIGISILLIFNDVSYRIIEKLMSGTYYRFLWGIPFVVVIAYMLVKVTEEQEKKNKRIVIFLVVIIMILESDTISGDCSLTLPENKYNITEDVIQVCEIIEEEKQVERPVVIFDLEMQLSARTYDASLVWGISRDAYIDCDNMAEEDKYQSENILIRAVQYGIKEDSEKLMEALKERNVDYIVTKTSFKMDEYFEGAGYELVGSSQNRSVYEKQEDLQK